MSITYMASPYFSPDPATVQSRVDAACRYAAKLMQEGSVVFSPIAHSHYIADHMDEALRTDHAFWMAQDLALLAHCSRVVVLCLPGWECSKGVAREIAEARLREIPIEYHSYPFTWYADRKPYAEVQFSPDSMYAQLAKGKA